MFVSLVTNESWFDLPTLVQLSGERRGTLLMQLSRWARSGLVIALRRGMYTLSPLYRRVPLNPAALAQALYPPSYLSCLWALSHCGLIPEAVVQYTSVTTRTTRRFENGLGRYSYAHLKPAAFFGYRPQEIGGAKVMIAEPEKALLDHWHLESGEWTAERIAEMRYQNTETVDPTRLAQMAVRFSSPRLSRAVSAWLAYAAETQKGTRLV